MATCDSALPGNLLDVLHGGLLTEEQARMIYDQGPEAVIFALLELTKRLAEQRAAGAGQSYQTPSTPSGMKPPYQKPPAKRRKRQLGAKPGHQGSRRKPPDRIIDHHKEHRADRCPALRRSFASLRGNPYALYRGHPGHPTGGHGAYDPPRLVSPLPETGRAGGSRRPAWRDAGQSCAGLVGLAALRPGQYAGPDRGGLQLPLADESHLRRAGADVVPLAGDALRLGTSRSNSKPCTRRCCTETKAAGEWMAKRTGCGVS